MEKRQSSSLVCKHLLQKETSIKLQGARHPFGWDAPTLIPRFSLVFNCCVKLDEIMTYIYTMNYWTTVWTAGNSKLLLHVKYFPLPSGELKCSFLPTFTFQTYIEKYGWNKMEEVKSSNMLPTFDAFACFWTNSWRNGQRPNTSVFCAQISQPSSNSSATSWKMDPLEAELFTMLPAKLITLFWAPFVLVGSSPGHHTRWSTLCWLRPPSWWQHGCHGRFKIQAALDNTTPYGN